MQEPQAARGGLRISAEAAAILEQSLRSALPLAVGVVCVYAAAFALLWGFLSEAPEARWLGLQAAAIAVGSGWLALHWTLRPPERPYPRAAALLAGLYTSSLLQIWLAPNPDYLNDFALISVCAFLLLGDRRWLAATIFYGACAFLLAIPLLHTGYAEDRPIFVLLTCLAGVLVHAVRVAGVQRGLELVSRTRSAVEAQKHESLGRMAGHVAHDFNNALTVIQGHAEIASDAGSSPDAAREAYRAIAAAARDAAGLCRQLLDFAGGRPLHALPTDLAALVRDAEMLMRPALPRGAQLSVEVAPEACWVRADAFQIRQMLLNLVLNAGAALPAGQGRIRVELGHAEAPGWIELCVSDSGVGIAPELQKRIFEPYFSTRGGGRGLGLASVYGIAKHHGGRIALDSEPGRGSRFRVLLPRIAAPAVSAPPAAARAAPEGGGEILLVDDEPAVLRVASRMLERLGFRAWAAPDGEAALAEFRRRPGAFRAALVDATMPGLDGLAVIARLRGLRAELPVVLCSGFVSESDAEGHEGAGPDAFLRKPYGLAELELALGSVLEQRERLPAGAA